MISSGGISVFDERKILATATAQTRTTASYTVASESVLAMTSELDIVLTPPQGTSKNLLSWTIFGMPDTAAVSSGFVVYRDIDGGGFTLLANSRNGAGNYWAVTGIAAYSSVASAPNMTKVEILDTSITAGSVHTYRIYSANTLSGGNATFYLNRPQTGTGSSTLEEGLSTAIGWSLA